MQKTNLRLVGGGLAIAALAMGQNPVSVPSELDLRARLMVSQAQAESEAYPERAMLLAVAGLRKAEETADVEAKQLAIGLLETFLADTSGPPLSLDPPELLLSNDHWVLAGDRLFEVDSTELKERRIPRDLLNQDSSPLLSPAGRFVVFKGKDGGLLLWEPRANTRTPVPPPAPGLRLNVEVHAFRHEDTFFIAKAEVAERNLADPGNPCFPIGSFTPVLHRVDGAAAFLVRILDEYMAPSKVGQVLIAPDGHHAVLKYDSASGLGWVDLDDESIEAPVIKLRTRLGAVLFAGFTNQGRQAFAQDVDGRVARWSVTDGIPTPLPEIGDQFAILATDPEAEILVAAIGNSFQVRSVRSDAWPVLAQESVGSTIQRAILASHAARFVLETELRLEIWEWTEVAKLKRLHSMPKPGELRQISPFGSIILAGSTVARCKGGGVILEDLPPTESVREVICASQRDVVVIGAGVYDQRGLHVFVDGLPIKTLECPLGSWEHQQISPCGRWLVIASRDAVVLWDLLAESTSGILRVFTSPDGPACVSGLAFQSDELAIILENDQQLSLPLEQAVLDGWVLETSLPVSRTWSSLSGGTQIVDHGGTVPFATVMKSRREDQRVAKIPPELTVIALSENGLWDLLWDGNTSLILRGHTGSSEVSIPFDARVREPIGRFSPSGDRFLLIGADYVEVRDCCEPARVLARRPHSPEFHDDWRFSQDGSVVWRVTSRLEKWTIESNFFEEVPLTADGVRLFPKRFFSPNGEWLVAGDHQGHDFLVSLAPLSPPRLTPLGVDVFQVHFTPDSRWLICDHSAQSQDVWRLLDRPIQVARVSESPCFQPAGDFVSVISPWSRATDEDRSWVAVDDWLRFLEARRLERSPALAQKHPPSLPFSSLPVSNSYFQVFHSEAGTYRVVSQDHYRKWRAPSGLGAIPERRSNVPTGRLMRGVFTAGKTPAILTESGIARFSDANTSAPKFFRTGRDLVGWEVTHDGDSVVLARGDGRLERLSGVTRDQLRSICKRPLSLDALYGVEFDIPHASVVLEGSAGRAGVWRWTDDRILHFEGSESDFLGTEFGRGALHLLPGSRPWRCLSKSGLMVVGWNSESLDITLLNVRSGTRTRVPTPLRDLEDWAWDDHGSDLYLRGKGQTVRLRSAAGYTAAEVSIPSEASLHWNRDGHWVGLTWLGMGMGGVIGGQTVLGPASSASNAEKVVMMSRGHSGRLLMTDPSGTVRSFHPEDRFEMVHRGFDSTPSFVATIANDRYVVAAEGGRLRIWPTDQTASCHPSASRNGSWRKDRRYHEQKPVDVRADLGCVYGPPERRFFSSEGDGCVIAAVNGTGNGWRLTVGTSRLFDFTPLGTINLHDEGLDWVLVAPDGKSLVICCPARLRFLRFESGDHGSGQFADLAPTKSAERAAWDLPRKSVEFDVWDPEFGRVAWTGENRIHLLEWREGRFHLRRIPTPVGRPVTGLEFVPGGASLLVHSHDGYFAPFELRPEDLATMAEATAGRPLSDRELSAFAIR